MPPAAPRRNRRVLDLIAVFKFLKAATLIAAGCGAVGLLNPAFQQRAELWLERLALGHGPRLIGAAASRVLPALDRAGPHRLALLGVGAFAYAAVFLVEGVGLMRERRWAEYLTVAVTISFLPFEVIELARKLSAPRVITLVLNVAVVVYLVWRIRAERKGRGDERGASKLSTNAA